MSTPAPKSPNETFCELLVRAKKQFDELKLDEATIHKLIAIRTEIAHAYDMLKFISPADKVKLHDKISEMQLISMKIGY